MREGTYRPRLMQLDFIGSVHSSHLHAQLSPRRRAGCKAESACDTFWCAALHDTPTRAARATICHSQMQRTRTEKVRCCSGADQRSDVQYGSRRLRDRRSLSPGTVGRQSVGIVEVSTRAPASAVCAPPLLRPRRPRIPRGTGACGRARCPSAICVGPRRSSGLSSQICPMCTL